ARRGVGQAQEKGEDEGQGDEQKDVGEGGGEEEFAQPAIAWRQDIRGGEERHGARRLCSFHELSNASRQGGPHKPGPPDGLNALVEWRSAASGPWSLRGPCPSCATC